jgi:hypothetical protein
MDAQPEASDRVDDWDKPSREAWELGLGRWSPGLLVGHPPKVARAGRRETSPGLGPRLVSCECG